MQVKKLPFRCRVPLLLLLPWFAACGDPVPDGPTGLPDPEAPETAAIEFLLDRPSLPDPFPREELPAVRLPAASLREVAGVPGLFLLPLGAASLEDAPGVEFFPMRREVDLGSVADLEALRVRPHVTGTPRRVVDRPLRARLELMRIGAPATLRLQFELDLRGATEDLEPTDLPTVFFQLGDERLGTHGWNRPLGTQKLEVTLEAAAGPQTIELVVADLGDPRREASLLLDQVTLQSAAPGDAVRFSSRRAEAVKIQPRAPAVYQVFEGGPVEWTLETLLVAGQAIVRAPGATSLEIWRGNEPAPAAQGALEIAQVEYQTLRVITAGPVARCELLQPAAAFRHPIPELRGSEDGELRTGPLCHVMRGVQTSRCVILPCSEEWRIPLRLEEGDRIELSALGLDHGAGRFGVRQAGIEIGWKSSARSGVETLASGPLPFDQSFRGLSLPWRAATGREGELVLRARAASPDAAGALASVALAEPRVVRASSRVARPASVVLYLVDTLRADHLGCYGYSRDTSPSLDALAAEGLCFERAYSTAPWTKPSVASIFTGLLPSFAGVHQETALPGSVHTLAERLRARGYLTAAFVANPYVHLRGLNFEQGFSEFVAVSTGSRIPHAGDVHQRVDRWVAEHADQPFFLYVHTLDPHEPYDPPPGARGRYSADYQGSLVPGATYARQLRRRSDLNAADIQYLQDLYDEEIRFGDEQIGRFVRHLRELSLYDSSHLVFLSDHGEEFHEHGSFGHGHHLWDELLHVPWIIKPAAGLGLAPARIAQPVSLTALLPTMLELLGLPGAAEALQGQSVLRARGAGGDALDLLAERSPDLRCMIRWPLKLIVRTGGEGEVIEKLLFDLHQDPGEWHDSGPTRAAEALALLRDMEGGLERDRLRGVGQAPPAALVELTADQEARLRELGYLDE